jgi:hypothetical protein
MTKTRSQVDTGEPAALVWAILSGFRTCGRWNSLIRGILGHPVSGRQVEIGIRSSSGRESRSRPTVVVIGEAREMKCRERWRLPRLFSSERRFRIEPLPQGGVHFHHDERVPGIPVTLIGLRRRMRGKPGYDAMNNALKLRAESAWARRAASTAH